MRFVIYGILCLALLNFRSVFPIESHGHGKAHELENVLPMPENHTESHDTPEITQAFNQVTTKKMFTAFRSPLEKIAPEATRTEISAIAKTLFGIHPLADEWVSRCYRLRRDGKGSFSELKRFAELQIQMLSDLDTTKHAEEIEAYQVALKELDQVVKIYKQAKTVSLPLRTSEELAGEAYGWDSKALEHLVKFESLLKETNLVTARAELLEIAKIRFGTHALADEWIPLYFRLSHEGKGLISDVTRISELEIRMFTAISAEKHTEPIQQHRKAMAQYGEVAKTLKAQGKNLETVEVDFKSPLDLIGVY